MRTNIVIDDKLMAEAMEASGLKTKRETVEAALRLLARQAKRREILDLAGRVDWDDGTDMRPPRRPARAAG